MEKNSTSDRPAVIPVFYGVRTQPSSRELLAGPCIHVDPACDKPLRLNHGGLDLHGKTDSSDAFARVKEVLTSHCDPWSRNLLLFIDRYFAFIEDQCERNRPLLEGILAPFGTVYAYRDFRFSAWLPLPLACISMETEIKDAPALVRTDFLFWSGAGFVAVELCSHTSRSRKRDAELQQLQAAGVRIVEINIDTLRTDHSAIFRSAFPSAFSEFWAGQLFPSGSMGPNASRFALDAARRA